jgi:phosphoserine phosphatase RsbU/P
MLLDERTHRMCVGPNLLRPQRTISQRSIFQRLMPVCAYAYHHALRLSIPALTVLAFTFVAILTASAQQPSTSSSPSTPPPHPPHLLHFLPHPHDHPHSPKEAPPDPSKPVAFDASTLGAPLTLDHNWRLGVTADSVPAADPAFDDSKWAVRDAKPFLRDVDDSALNDDPEAGSASAQDTQSQDNHGHGPHKRGSAWFRLHILLPAHHGPLVLLVRVPVSRNTQVSFSEGIGMELYANGKLVLPEGLNGPTPDTYQQTSRIYPLNLPEDETSLTLAIRIPYVPFGIDAYTAFFAHRTFFLGSGNDLRDHLDLWRHAMLFERLPSLVDCGLKVVMALFLIALFWTQRDHPEYLWLGLHFILVAPMAYIGMAGSMGQIDQLWLAALIIQLLLISAYFYFEFLVAFLALRKRWYIIAMRYSAPLLLAFGPLLLLVRESRAFAVPLVISILFAVAWAISWVIFTGLTLTISAIKRNYEAALLLFPLLLSIVGMAEFASTASSTTWLGTQVQSPLTFEAGPIPIHFSDIADFIGIFVVILIIFVRFLRIHRERERASSELAAARSVQELMIPREAPQTPGFQVDTVYTPATEVGGDFFHIEPTGDGGLLIVLGDVAGHGLQAAMNVSMLMGALRRSPVSTPAAMLSDLNQVLVGSASFTTCEIALFHPNGELTIASAGHPPPYLNSQEIELPGGLPLGVVAGVDYEEIRLYLHPGDRLLMMSDGVAEARKPNGELFGFDRIRNLSNQSAFFIADAAKEFGQEDDITVLTVHRLAHNIAAA